MSPASCWDEKALARKKTPGKMRANVIIFRGASNSNKAVWFQTSRRNSSLGSHVRLTQIKLSGFKSFVDPTTIHVPGQRVGVVGPNGCGKPNVIDAVRWVLGETRASALRGDSMQDVIFNGSLNRAPLARAAVELAFDNSLGRAAGQWSQYAELSVRRVLQRDGESSYYINGTHVRRRDITDMFLGTGLGPRAYAIIEQGMISRVIEAKPEDLRVFLEEAAGISKYKERRRETETRLADTRENLARISDIRLELGLQIEKLDAQAQIATRYKELQDDLQLKQHLLWYLRRRDAAAERERHAAEVTRVGNELEAENAQSRSLESRLETARSAHYQAGDTMNAAQAALYGANAEVARHESELRHAEETRARLESQHTERRTQLAAWREQRSQLTQALHMWAGRAGGAKQRVTQTRQALDEQNARLPQAEQAFRAAQERLSEARSQLMQAENRLQLEQANRAHLGRAAETLVQRSKRWRACKQNASRCRRRAPRRPSRSGRHSVNTPLRRHSSQHSSRSRPTWRTTRRSVSGSSGTDSATLRSSGRSCASTRDGKRRSRPCCANACTRCIPPRSTALSRSGRRPRPACSKHRAIFPAHRLPACRSHP